MSARTVWLSSVFATGIVGLALAAGWRATPVRLPGDADLLNGRSAREFESHYDQVFPARSLGINLWGAIEYVLFHEGRPGVVVGRQGWLYTSEEFGAAEDSEPLIEAHLDQVAQVRDRLAHAGTALVVVLLPAKARVYPEYLGHRRPDAQHDALYDRLLVALRAVGITAPDLMRALMLCKPEQDVFLRTDTHWTPSGARCVARQVAREARRTGLRLAPAQFRTRVTAVEPHRGDLEKFLGLEPWFQALGPEPELVEVTQTASAQAALLGDAPAAQAVLIGTSYSANARWNFAGALQQQLGADVVNFAADGEGPFRPMDEYLRAAPQGAPPRLAIWEMPERYFPMPDGPMKDVAAPQTQPGGHSS